MYNTLALPLNTRQAWLQMFQVSLLGRLTDRSLSVLRNCSILEIWALSADCWDPCSWEKDISTSKLLRAAEEGALAGLLGGEAAFRWRTLEEETMLGFSLLWALTALNQVNRWFNQRTSVGSPAVC